MLSADPEGQPSCLLVFKSCTGKVEVVDILVSADQTPYAFMVAIADAYMAKLGMAKRLFYRCILLKKIAVSTATLSRVTKPGLKTISEHQGSDFIITSYNHDTILTSAIREPGLLNDVDPDSFFSLYRDIIVEESDINGSRTAILIHLEDEPVASKAFRILGSVVSLAVGLSAAIAL